MRDCTKCGKCCIKYPALQADDEDIERFEWHDELNPEKRQINDWVGHPLGDLWVYPEEHRFGNEECDRCPWIRKNNNASTFRCTIHEYRPNVCRNYPVDVEQMRNDGCEMLEPSDLAKSDADLTLELAKIKMTWVTA